MDKVYPIHSSAESSASMTTGSTTASAAAPTGGLAKSDGSDYLRHLNKLSHKISKPPLKRPPFDPPPVDDPPPPPPQNQPPVYTINKNDFRDVVHKLTGSPAHERVPVMPAAPSPPTVPAPKHPNSRLQRIRPPPLAPLSTRPSPQLMDPNAITSLNPNPNPPFFLNNLNFPIGRPSAPLSPLPPLPSVHGAAESPVSGYLRHLHTSLIPPFESKGDLFMGSRPSVSPHWNKLGLPPLPVQGHLRPPEGTPPPLQLQHQQQLPVSSLMPFGCSSSTRSPYNLISPGLLFSPTSLGFPLSPPAVPVPSPRSGGA